jgi:hypothetical protein
MTRSLWDERMNFERKDAYQKMRLFLARSRVRVFWFCDRFLSGFGFLLRDYYACMPGELRAVCTACLVEVSIHIHVSIDSIF